MTLGETVTEVVPAPAPSLPHWPTDPPPVDPTGASYVVVAIGPHHRTREVAAVWVADIAGRAPITLVMLDGLADPRERPELVDALNRARTGVRMMVVGGQHDVLAVLTTARDAGAVDTELSAYCVHTDDLPMYCAHCCSTHRVEAAPGNEVICPGCGRLLEIRAHFTRALGSFLAADAHAADSPVERP